MAIHGHTVGGKRTKEWRTWNAMIRRCKYPSMQRFHRYGGLGISVCERWLNFNNFLDDVGPAPSESHSLGRIDHTKNYEPGNVRWETPREQSRNKSTTRMLTLNGITMPLCDWSLKTGLKRTTITQRIDSYGWTIERALTEPNLRRSHHA